MDVIGQKRKFFYNEILLSGRSGVHNRYATGVPGVIGMMHVIRRFAMYRKWLFVRLNYSSSRYPQKTSHSRLASNPQSDDKNTHMPLFVKIAVIRQIWGHPGSLWHTDKPVIRVDGAPNDNFLAPSSYCLVSWHDLREISSIWQAQAIVSRCRIVAEIF